MIENNLTYEPSFENKRFLKDVNKSAIDYKCKVPVLAAFGDTPI